MSDFHPQAGLHTFGTTKAPLKGVFVLIGLDFAKTPSNRPLNETLYLIVGTIKLGAAPKSRIFKASYSSNPLPAKKAPHCGELCNSVAGPQGFEPW